ncbi:MAG: carboxypeptidase regulatory-like domain-containing protein, partial [Candidatus Acidiferrales bacterium]
MLLRVFLRVSLLAVLILSAGSAIMAQTTGEIQGTVKDPSGALVPGANVTATSLATAEARTAQSGKDGDFEFTEMAIGHYAVTVEAPGFKKSTIKDVEVTLGHVTLANTTLQVGGATETVTVEGQAAQVETSSTQIGAVMNDVAVSQLPLTSRDAYQLLQLQPGVQSQLGADLFYGSSNVGVVSVNGGRGRANNYMVNGGDGNDIFVNLPAIQPSPDAIEEFRVITNTFDAEYGRNSGSVVNVVTKSGTNQVHGDTYEFFRNKDLNARGAFDTVNPQYNQNQFGATIGGPIKKDRTFIFGSYEGDRLRQGIPSGSVTLPSAAEAGGDFSAGPTFVGTMVNPTFASEVGARTTGGSGTTCDSAATAQQVAANSPWQGGVSNSVGQYFQNIFPGNVIPVQCYDPTALDLYNGYVAPYGTGTIGLTPVKPEREDQTTLRLDHKLTNSQQLSAYYYFDDDNHTDPFSDFQAAGANVPGFGGIFKTRVQQVNVSHTWTIGSTSVNESRFNFFRESQGNLNHPERTFASVQSSCPTVASSV